MPEKATINMFFEKNNNILYKNTIKYSKMSEKFIIIGLQFI